MSDPKGGMVLWLQVPNLDVDQFRSLVEQGKIDIRLGHLFSTLALYNDCFRINIGYELNDTVKTELDKLVDAILKSS